jgi:hypothetical protein
MKWLLPLIMTVVTIVTGGLVTWQFNDDPKTAQEREMIEMVENKMENSPLKYIVIKYGIEWENNSTAIVSGRTIFNMPVIKAKIDKQAVR